MFSHRRLKDSENNRNPFSKAAHTAYRNKRAEAENPVLCVAVASKMTLSHFNASSLYADGSLAYIHLRSMFAGKNQENYPAVVVRLKCMHLTKMYYVL